MIDLCSLDSEKLLSLDHALKNIINSVKAVSGTEIIPLPDALGRILALTVTSPIDLPYERNSAMDGYAFDSTEVNLESSFSLQLAGTSWAGNPFVGVINKGECLRVFTGAVVPGQLDTVVMQEQVKVIDNRVHFPASIRSGQFIRPAGEDIKAGEPLIEATKCLSAADIGYLAAAGIHHVRVRRPLRIAYLATGDELVSPGQPLSSGKIFESNRSLLRSLLNDAAFTITDLGIIKDDKSELKETLLDAADNHDVIISTGGASVGDADFIKEILDDCGRVGFWKIAVKPGKPFAFGWLKDCVFFGLPGNPVSVMVAFDKIVMPALRQMIGARPTSALRIQAVSTENIKKAPGRQEFMRGILSFSEDNRYEVKSAGNQGSHILSVLSRANCYIDLPATSRGVTAGESVWVEPFSIQIER
ncbi:gephyrin-like molybdotransferase Glp [Methylicorpusculum sp.]|uniref:molybdopterin molybdotransferase MoeA n=1 Tax=Methylicorpusculum sp. TaxID=2713644 RepID=UPI0027269C0C|nr:gephyrin-like molybdotransferase Glp [Methylicorpusculum sp.]MDO9241923.1 molybdopterin molybdotransferase MoeA [Methylicorpusculum sp.]MDP2177679.1 molybdopterin molybdotransferase MoeA [Methylicorpusculum sp.]MDP3528623.1 molybdopterin molybdotransferase MoeA [Methylicorpusculum sp.]MDZ4153892.1 gephyrin-like molybdotransferase Glp [Methylicorpusculum sp.]